MQSTFSVSLSLLGVVSAIALYMQLWGFQSWRNSEVSSVSCNRVAYAINVFCVSKSFLEWSVSWWPVPSVVSYVFVLILCLGINFSTMKTNSVMNPGTKYYKCVNTTKKNKAVFSLALSPYSLSMHPIGHVDCRLES
jgi:hypothetical protein